MPPPDGGAALGGVDMKYLMYYINGFLKKFPLDKSPISIGRSGEHDLALHEDFISRNHVQVMTRDDGIVVRDLESTNGITVREEKVKEASIDIGESFILGKMEFFLKRGELDEFELAKELIPILDTISSENEQKFDHAITRYIDDIYSETLKTVMQAGLKSNDYKAFMLDLPNHLSNFTDFGSLFIIAGEAGDFDVCLSMLDDQFKVDRLKKLVKARPEMFTRKQTDQSIPLSRSRLYAYPLKSSPRPTTLAFVLKRIPEKEKAKFEGFLASLVVEIDLFSQLLTGQVKKGEKSRPRSAAATEIVADSEQMKNLIKQAMKIAASDIFVLIQGESGTGKELFARLIHRHSKRVKEQFVALNCAAIPEDLLESELFGHEKGAFTGAYTQRKGKLEVASGGTLVLDEIGDMPINLQSKLLRAIQEKEFYRLGGATPIHVDLRIISITNRDLKQLIEDGQFREDLYYRLVHRTITIPPLRERREDISTLINFFTGKFCQEINKKINGYSVKAFEALQSYHWKGNVRQLENEIRSIVNLTEDGETVGYDILSEEVMEGAGKEPETGKSRDTRELNKLEMIPLKLDPETEKAYILKALEQSNWNKSQAARLLNMTYRGLHKKMKRLGL